MKKYFFSGLFSCFLISSLSAQMEFEPLDLHNGSQWFSMENSHSEGDTVYIFGDIVNVRKTADASSEIIGKVKIGTAVVIQEVAEKDIINGMNCPWYEISFQQGNQAQKGYVWGGLLAFGAFDIENVSLLFGGVKKVENLTEGITKNEYEIRVAQAGQLVTSCTQYIDGYSSQEGTFTTIDGLGYEGFQGGIWIYSGGGACGVSSYQWFVFWDGNTLRPLPVVSGVGDGGVFYEYTDYIFPSQIPQGMGFSGSESRIYVKYELFETGGDGGTEDEYDEIEFDQKTILRALKVDDKGRFSMPKGIPKHE